MDFEYLDAFARPNTAKSYEKKSEPILGQNTDLTETEKRIFGIKDDDVVKTKSSSSNLVTATPLTPPVVVSPPITAPIKTAPIDTILFEDDTVPIEVITDLIFENIGGHELINIARNDIINGQEVSYQLIKNLLSIQQQYNPNNIIKLQDTLDKYFSNFPIKFENKIPEQGDGPNGAFVYLDQNTGNLVIEAINLEPDEQIQVEITTSGTIYEAEFGESNS